MGRGLSQLQRDVLGVAYAVNAYTQEGSAAVKVRGDEPVDLVTPLAVYAIYRVAPVEWGKAGAAFVRSPAVNVAFAACSRTITRLCNRGLLVWQQRERIEMAEAVRRVDNPNPIEQGQPGYVLTRAGLDVAAGCSRELPAIAEALRFFDVIRVPARERDWGEWRDVLVTTIQKLDGGNR